MRRVSGSQRRPGPWQCGLEAIQRRLRRDRRVVHRPFHSGHRCVVGLGDVRRLQHLNLEHSDLGAIRQERRGA